MSAAAEFSWTSAECKSELQLAFDAAPIGLVECHGVSDVRVLNSALERLIGIRPSMDHAISFKDLLHFEDGVDGERLLREIFDGKCEHFQLDSKSPADGRPVRWRAWRVPGGEGKPDYALAIAEDLQENSEGERRIRQAQRLETVGRLASGVAHDFNNLLTGILLYCDLMMESLTGHPARKYAEEIRNAGMQGAGLVKQLLAVTRPSNCEPRLLSLNDIAESMRNLLLRLIGENIKLECRLDPDLGLIRMDQTQAQQILLNLVLNARDAMIGGGEIKVETRNCRVQILTEANPASRSAILPCALFAVEDNGAGMDPTTRSHLFEAFYTTKGGKGNGLGLATVHDIVTGNGGLIHVDSAPACGTRVSVLLPLVPETAPNSLHPSPTLPDRQDGPLSHSEKE